MKDGRTLRVIMAMLENNGAWKMDVVAPKVTPFTSSLKVEISPFISFVGTCTMLEVIRIIFFNINDLGIHI